MKESNIIEMKQKISQPISYHQPKQRSKRIAGIIGPPILWLGMFLIYQFFGAAFGSEIGWYLGLFTYWMVCGLLFSSWLIGIKRIKQLSFPRRCPLAEMAASCSEERTTSALRGRRYDVADPRTGNL